VTDINEVHWYCPTPGPATHIVRITSEADLEAGVHHVHHVVVQSEAGADDNLGKHAATMAGVIARNWLEGHVGGDTATWKILTVRAICPGVIGMNTRSIPDLRGCSEYNFKAPLQISWVLIEGEIGDYAVYCGCGEPDDIKRHGDKVSFREACDHFPGGQLVEGLYRR